MVEKQSVGIRESHVLYKTEVKKKATREEYLAIAQRFNQFLADKLLTGEEICLPEGLGRMKFIGTKTKPKIDDHGKIQGLAPDWKRTNELWLSNPVAKENKTLVYFFNEHSNGIRYRLHWVKRHVTIRNKDFFSFRLSRENKHRFKDAINEGKEFIVQPRKEPRVCQPRNSEK